MSFQRTFLLSVALEDGRVQIEAVAFVSLWIPDDGDSDSELMSIKIPK